MSEKDTELARMEHDINKIWAEIQKDWMCSERSVDAMVMSYRMAAEIIKTNPLLYPAGLVLCHGMKKFVRAAREADLLPKQRGV